LIDEENKDVFYLLKNNICGGPSIVFHRYHEAGQTKIKRPTNLMSIINKIMKE
jgi:hypothetical protein